MLAMAFNSQATFSVNCEFGDSAFHFELPVARPDQQVQLLRYLSDAYTGFLQELKPEDSALCEMVEDGIKGMAQLSIVLSASSSAEGSTDPSEENLGIASAAAPSIVEEDGKKETKHGSDPKERDARSSKRRVRFVLERDDGEESEEEDWIPPVRSMAFVLQDARKSGRRGSASDQDVSKKPRDFRSIVPSKQATESRSLSSRLRAAMQEVRVAFPISSRRSGQVCPAPPAK
eukprot:TRINITY_DN15234_c0_g2_i1.p1 TRINITY_DN15234_c0_g2~~TRINITY_DN15234_c0_g2_i1.p1  ORF type:complete len:232 (-),score=58.41 TRINITY_DN15234_c0_g2_i1:44-739(-)